MLPSSPTSSALGGAARGRFWGLLPNGRAVHHWTLRNACGMRVEISNLGGVLLNWWAPNRHGRMDDVVLGHPQPADYLRSRAAPIALSGPGYAGDAPAGPRSRADRPAPIWDVATDGDALMLETIRGEDSMHSLHLRAHLDDDGTLSLDYQVRSAVPFPMDLLWRHHFNLNGGRTDVRGHVLRVYGSGLLAPETDGRMPVRRSVAGTAFDFRSAAPLGARLDWPRADIGAGNFDACYVLGGPPHRIRRAATLADPASGRLLDVFTDQQGLYLDAGRALHGETGRDGTAYPRHAGVALNACALADDPGTSPHRFGSLRWLVPGDIGTLRARYRLGTLAGVDLG